MRLGWGKGRTTGRSLGLLFFQAEVIHSCLPFSKDWTSESGRPPATSREDWACRQLISTVVLYNYFSRGRAPGKSHDSYINRSKCTLIFTISSFRRSKGNRRKGGIWDQIFILQGKSVNPCTKLNCTVKGCIPASTILKKLYYYSMKSMPNIIFILKKNSQAISFRF